MILNVIFQFLSKIFLFAGRLGSTRTFEKPLEVKVEREYFVLLQNGENEYREIIIKHNLRLVAHIAKKYKGVRCESDLLSVGSLGLLKAVNTYKLDNGNEFSTYASRCIENEILMLLRSEKKRQGDVFLDDKIGQDKDGNPLLLSDCLENKTTNFENEVLTKMIGDDLIVIINEKLSERDAGIIKLRFGLENNVPLTQMEVATIYGISRSYISRIETNALTKLKSEIIKRKLLA
ncbi:MAG: sigma-70 family RNA polymerase sigma factor [Clostridia bacterium]